MPAYGVSTWKPIPFLRILTPLLAGILLQFHLQAGLHWLYVAFITGLLMILSARLLSLSRLYLLRWVPGIGIHLLFMGLGGILTIDSNIENNKHWVGNHYKEDAVIATIQEPLVEKPRSYKALATIESLHAGTNSKFVIGNMLIYFQRDSIMPELKYGAQLLIRKILQPITNSGNPGGFDYSKYCAFQGIHYQVFLKKAEYVVLPTTKTNWFNRSLIEARSWVLSVLRKYIQKKDEVAVAEALLIGYRDDLDKELVQSYSNTGVVHIIAISGLHLGMIYGLLVWLFAPFRQRRWCRLAKPVTILCVLWAFTFIAGAVPSILRSAVMFSCIILGESLAKRSSIYNTLAASAFLLLLYNPFYLWDVGFQLSYTAVLSIIVFQKTISNWFYFQNRILSGIWRLSAISLAAQVLTLPVVLYHFHQFPNLFLLTNLIVVPLSGLILFAEIFLLIISFVPLFAVPFGKMTEWMIGMMNGLIERTDTIPFAVTDGIQVTIPQALFIYGTILFLTLWLMQKNRRMLMAGMMSFAGYIGLRSIDLIHTNRQQKIIVYNIPQHTAMDIIEGDTYMFYGDTALLQDGFLCNFHLRPSRIVNRMSPGILQKIQFSGNLIKTSERTVAVVNSPLPFNEPPQKINADALIITGNPRLYISQLKRFYNCRLVVFDATNPSWKIRLWKKDCDSLHLRHYSIPEQGAFEMDL